MDTKNVTLVLALNLIAIGCLLALIDRRLADAGSLRGFAVGSIVFGLAYLLRLTQSPGTLGAMARVADVAMIFSTLCYATGLRRFSKQAPIGRHRIRAALAIFAVVSWGAAAQWQSVGRHAALNLGLGGSYLEKRVCFSVGGFAFGWSAEAPAVAK